MNNFFSFLKKNEFIVRIFIVCILYISIFFSFYTIKVDPDWGYREDYTIFNECKTMFEIFKEGRIPFFGIFPISFFVPISFLSLGIFGKYHRVFEKFWNIGCIFFIGFFFTTILYELSPIWKNLLCENDALIKSSCYFGFSFYIWLLLFIADFIYIIKGLEKAYPKEYKRKSKNERIAELEKQIYELQNNKKDS